ncbi:hypothetical protein QBC35DRAFT_65341 [Podospora australis]|uniref:Dehydrogenase n=1 Tax=Podospora australis TaxID=1536484 RepID=A0AAN6WLU1_9PEZI|nr:hypothetical protein QBC35DRAFT_65341 [Podospora australis]
MATRRENRGIHADNVGRLVRYTLLNEYLALPIAGAAHYLTLKTSRKILVKLIRHAASLGLDISKINFGSLARKALYLGIAGFALSANDFLTKWTANNWAMNKKDEWSDWSKEIVVITGGSSGIGENIAKLLLARNPKVTIVILDFAPLSWSIPKENRRRVHYYQADLSKPEVIKSVCRRIRKDIGHPTVLVNNAGLSRGFTVVEGRYADVEVTLKTNLQAPFLLAKEFLPDMIKKDHGHIVNMCSMSAVVPPPGIVDYAASKAGLQALHEGLALELKYRHKAPRVRLTNVIPHFIRTPLFHGTPNQPRFLSPLLHVETVAEAVVNTLQSGYGQVIYLPGIMRYVTMLRALPEWAFRILIRNGTANLAANFQGRQVIDENGGLKPLSSER